MKICREWVQLKSQSVKVHQSIIRFNSLGLFMDYLVKCCLGWAVVVCVKAASLAAALFFPLNSVPFSLQCFLPVCFQHVCVSKSLRWATVWKVVGAVSGIINVTSVSCGSVQCQVTTTVGLQLWLCLRFRPGLISLLSLLYLALLTPLGHCSVVIYFVLYNNL